MKRRRFPVQIAWHVAAVAAVLLVPPLVRLGEPTWSVGPALLPFILLLGAAYVAGAVVLLLLGPAVRSRLHVILAVASTVLLGVCVCLLLFPGLRYSRPILLMGSGLVFLLLGGGARLRGRWVSVLLPLALIGIALLVRVPAVEGDTGGDGEVARRLTETDLQSTYFPVHMASYSGFLPEETLIGGGLEPLEDGLLLVRGRGDFHLIAWDGADSLRVSSLDLRTPDNRQEFEADTDTIGGVRARQFRVTDLLVSEEGDSVSLFASHHFWFRDRRCYVLRLSVVRLPKGPGGTIDWSAAAGSSWRTVFDTRPCLPIKEAGRVFGGPQSGGKLLGLGRDTILMTVGDHEFDGLNAPIALAQDGEADYGKTLLVDVRSGRAEIFTGGHRNPQGLARAADGSLWLTEHGPRGGDELNRLSRGANYGWPFHTFGTDYGSATGAWPLVDSAATGYVLPTYAWVPSIAVSAAEFIGGSRFPEWRGDLLVGSLKARSLWRLELQENRVVYAEPLEIGFRIRDLAEARDGTLVLWTDEGTLVRLSPSDAPGAVLMRLCNGCHTVDDGTEHGIGPDLAGVFRRPVASAPGFDYSGALERLRGMWTDDRLDGFLADPDSFAPGTTMTGFEGMEDEGERSILIDYLKSAAGNR